MSYIGNPRKGFSVMAYNQQKLDREKKAQGNLHQNYPAEFMEKVWEGCGTRDCLPKCDLRKGHCERLKLEYAGWLSLSPQENAGD